VARIAFATGCGFFFLLAMSGTARTEPPCSGIAITDVIETASGELTSVGERCYERGPGVPFYYDAPGKRLRGVEPEIFHSADALVTQFEASTLEACGVLDIEDLANPFPPGQGRADFRPE
jgi:hypothetical protein